MPPHCPHLDFALPLHFGHGLGGTTGFNPNGPPFTRQTALVIIHPNNPHSTDTSGQWNPNSPSLWTTHNVCNPHQHFYISLTRINFPFDHQSQLPTPQCTLVFTTLLGAGFLKLYQQDAVKTSTHAAPTSTCILPAVRMAHLASWIALENNLQNFIYFATHRNFYHFLSFRWQILSLRKLYKDR